MIGAVAGGQAGRADHQRGGEPFRITHGLPWDLPEFEREGGRATSARPVKSR
jgi:hypothetical protein